MPTFEDPVADGAEARGTSGGARPGASSVGIACGTSRLVSDAWAAWEMSQVPWDTPAAANPCDPPSPYLCRGRVPPGSKRATSIRPSAVR
jgi:hypothetical protein